MSEDVVVIKGLSKAYPKDLGLSGYLIPFRKDLSWAVRDLDLRVARNEVFGFLGPNGAGKSTVLAILAGVLRPSKGTVNVMGHDISVDGPGARASIGFAPETPALYPEMKPIDLVSYHAGFYELEGDPVKMAEKVLASLGLENAGEKPVGQLSHGNQKKVSLAIALVHDPDLLLLDEPTSGLDPGSVAQFRDIIKGLKERGKTVFISSHLLTEVERICGTVGIMVQGRLKLVDSTDKVLSRAGDGGLEKVFMEVTGGGKDAGHG